MSIYVRVCGIFILFIIKVTQLNKVVTITQLCIENNNCGSIIYNYIIQCHAS